MALQIFDRIKERIQTGAGTGSLTLLGAPTGFKTFSSRLSVSDTTYYCIEGPGGVFEIGVGTLTTSTTLARTTILKSSNSDAAISIGDSGQYFVFITLAADKAVYKDGSGRIVSGAAGIIFSDASIQTTAATTPDLSAYAPLASPTFTGTPAAPTATSGTNTTQIATTAFVASAVGSIDLTPYALLPDTLPAVGTLLSYGGNRQLAAGGTVTHSGALNLGANALTVGAITASGNLLVNAAYTSSVPQSILRGTAGVAAYRLQTSDTGSANTDGFGIELSTTTAYLWNYENASLVLGTNNTTCLTLAASGAATFAGAITASGLVLSESGGTTSLESAANAVAIKASGSNKSIQLWATGGIITYLNGSPKVQFSTDCLRPWYATTYDLGDGADANYRWRDLWLTRNATIGGTITGASSLSLGATGQTANTPTILLSHDAWQTRIISFYNTVQYATGGDVHAFYNGGSGPGNAPFRAAIHSTGVSTASAFIFGATSTSVLGDVRLVRNSSTSVGVKASDGTTDAALTCGAITASGKVTVPAGSSSSYSVGTTSGTLVFGINTTKYVFGIGQISASVQYLSGIAQSLIGFSPSTDPTANPDTAIARNAAGVLEINNGTAGTFRDLSCRAITASGIVSTTSVRDGGSGDHYLSAITRDLSYNYFSLTANGLQLGNSAGLRFFSAVNVLGTPDATFTRNAAGVLQVGTTTANAAGSLLLTNLTASGAVSVGGDLTIGGAECIDAYATAPTIKLRRANGTLASPAGVGSGGTIGLIGSYGYHTSSAFHTGIGAYISFVSAEAYTSSSQATELRFATTPTGSTTATVRVTVGSDGVTCFSKLAAQTSEITNTPSGTTQTITLDSGNHQTLALTSSTGAVTATFTVPSHVSTGTVIIKQHGTTVRDITWAVSAGTLRWMGTEPTWSSDAVNDVRILSWRWNGSVLYLMATDIGA